VTPGRCWVRFGTTNRGALILSLSKHGEGLSAPCVRRTLPHVSKKPARAHRNPKLCKADATSLRLDRSDPLEREELRCV